jgi:MFS family permease
MTRNAALTRPRKPSPPIGNYSVGQQVRAFLVLALGLYVASAEYSALNTGLRTLALTFRASESSLALIVDAFGLLQAGLLIPAGWAGDRLGRRHAFVAGLAVIVAGAVWAARAGNTLELIGARGLMGAGSALEIPTFLGTLRSMASTAAGRVRMAMTYSAVIGLGVATGPIAGGWAIQEYGVRWIFWGTAALAATALGLAALVPQTRDPEATPTDFLGAVIAIIALGALLGGVIEGPSHGWSNRLIVAALAGGAAMVGVFAWRQRTTDRPLIDRVFLAQPRLWTALLAIFTAYGIVGGTLFALSPQLQVVLGYGPFAAGIRQAPAAAGAMLGYGVALLTERLRWRVSHAMALGFTLLLIAEMILATVGPRSGYPPLLVTMLLGGIGWGIVTARGSGVIMDLLPEGRASAGAALDESVRQTALIAPGVALTSTLIDVVFRHRIAQAIRGLPPSVAAAARGNVAAAAETAHRLGPLGLALGQTARQAYTTALGATGGTYAIAAGAAAALALAIGRTPRDHEVEEPSRHQPEAVSGSESSPRRGGDLVRHAERLLLHSSASEQALSEVGSISELLWRNGLQGLVDLASADDGEAVLPASMSAGDRLALQAAGVRFGESTNDPLFVYAVLPHGWSQRLHWRRRRNELVDAEGIIRAVVRYRASFHTGEREADLAVVVHAREHEVDPIRLRELMQLGAVSGTWPASAEELADAVTVAGIRSLTLGTRWVYLPNTPALRELLRRPGFAAYQPPEGHDLLCLVSMPSGWRLVADEQAQIVHLVDDRGLTQGTVAYRSGPSGPRWACMSLTEPAIAIAA